MFFPPIYLKFWMFDFGWKMFGIFIWQTLSMSHSTPNNWARGLLFLILLSRYFLDNGVERNHVSEPDVFTKLNIHFISSNVVGIFLQSSRQEDQMWDGASEKHSRQSYMLPFFAAFHSHFIFVLLVFWDSNRVRKYALLSAKQNSYV